MSSRCRLQRGDEPDARRGCEDLTVVLLGGGSAALASSEGATQRADEPAQETTYDPLSNLSH
jgi:hypothetical protein